MITHHNRNRSEKPCMQLAKSQEGKTTQLCVDAGWWQGSSRMPYMVVRCERGAGCAVCSMSARACSGCMRVHPAAAVPFNKATQRQAKAAGRAVCRAQLWGIQVRNKAGAGGVQARSPGTPASTPAGGTGICRGPDVTWLLSTTRPHTRYGPNGVLRCMRQPGQQC